MSDAFRIVNTRAGFVSFVASERGLRFVFLPEPHRAAALREIRARCGECVESATLLPALADELRRYFAGEPVRFTARPDFHDRTSFEIDVWNACRTIGYGCTSSYGALAARVGRPGGARAVGVAMSRNPIPIVVPCHRVLRSDGSIGGYSGHGGVEFKKQLIEMEAAAAIYAA